MFIKVFQLFMVLLVMISIPGFAEATLYSWEDESGAVSYTDDPANIPKIYRRSTRILDVDLGEESKAPAEQPAPKQVEVPSSQPPRIEGKIFLGHSGGFNYFFDRTDVKKAGRDGTLQYAIAILEVGEKDGLQKNGSLIILCGSDKVVSDGVKLPEEYIQSLRTRFCVQGGK